MPSAGWLAESTTISFALTQNLAVSRFPSFKLTDESAFLLKLLGLHSDSVVLFIHFLLGDFLLQLPVEQRNAIYVCNQHSFTSSPRSHQTNAATGGQNAA